MKIPPLLFDLSAECVGVIIGLCLVYPSRGSLHTFLESPGMTLAVLALLGSTAGAVVGGLASIQGEYPAMAARRGARAAAWAILTGGICLVHASTRFSSGSISWRMLVFTGAAAIPAMAVGAIPATASALYFRRLAPESGPSEVTSPLSPPIRWLMLVALMWGLVSAVLAPFRIYRPPPPALPQTARTPPPPPPEPAFSYTTPEALNTAPVTAWEVSASRDLGRMDQNGGLALSPDYQFVAGMADNQTLVVHDLNSEAARRISPIPSPATQMAFSPDGKRLFLVLEGQPKALAVVILETGRVIPLPQPKRHAVPEGAVFWDKEESVSFIQKGGTGASLDLLTLEITSLSLSPDDYGRFEREPRFALPKNERFTFSPVDEAMAAQLPETEGTEKWSWTGRRLLALSDTRYPVRRYFPEIEVDGADRVAGVPDGSKILRLRNYNLVVFYFGTRPPPPLRWRVSLPEAPEKMDDDVRRALDLGGLRMNLYSPLVNPLTGKTIGPDRERVKARVRISSWKDTEAEVWIEALGDPPTSGDVFADPYILGPEIEILHFDQPHRWWTVASDPLPDAEDVAKLDATEVLEKPKDEAVARLKSEAAGKPSNAVAGAAREQPPQSLGGSPPPSDRLTIDDVWKDEHEGGPPRGGANADEVRAFVSRHHRRISEGKVAEMVSADYAATVDHFRNGMVTRDFILKDELAYHRQYKFVRERLRHGEIRVRTVGEGWCEARYLMDNDWEKLDGRTGKGAFLITLGLERQSGGWRIISQRADKLN